MWEDKYKTDMGKQSQEIAKLKIKLRAEKIGRAELRAENQSIRDALRAMEQSLVEHENYIVELCHTPNPECDRTEANIHLCLRSLDLLITY